MDEMRPRILIVGHARHGKDTVAEILNEVYGLTFQSSSMFVGERCVWPTWGKDRYESFEAMFADRVNYRETWSNLIRAYNTPDLSRTGREMIEELGNDMYVGMRDRDEFLSCMKDEIFDVVIWVDASDRLPPEDNQEFTIKDGDAHYIIDNNGPLEALPMEIKSVMDLICEEKGFRWNMPISDDYVPIPRIEGQDEPIHVSPQDFSIAKYTESVVEVVPENHMGILPEGAVEVLDHGYVVVAGVNGTDADIAKAARLSYGRGTKAVNKDEGLIRYLYMNAHTSPFEMVSIKFQMRLPVFIMRQLVRHRTAHLNEYSGRYSEMHRLFYIPSVEQLCLQHAQNKQGSGEALPEGTALGIQAAMRRISNACFDEYEGFLEQKLSRESARIILPLNTYTEVIWQMDLNNMLKFLWLRDDSHAQWEIQVYAKIIAEAVKQYFPATYAAYERKRKSITLTKEQIYALVLGNMDGLPKGEKAQVESLNQEIQEWFASQPMPEAPWP